MPKKPTNPFYDKYHLFTRNNAQITIIIHQSKNLTRSFRVSIRHFLNTVGIFYREPKNFRRNPTCSNVIIIDMEFYLLEIFYAYDHEL